MSITWNNNNSISCDGDRPDSVRQDTGFFNYYPRVLPAILIMTLTCIPQYVKRILNKIENTLNATFVSQKTGVQNMFYLKF